MIRGLAALAVCVGHARSFFVTDYAQTAHTLSARLFYLLTGFQQQAVMIFFVLSGYLVGGSVIKAYRQGRWSWSDYLSRRLSRLWIVIAPALLLTLLWDTLGASGHGAPGYSCRWLSLVHSGPCAGSWHYDLSPAAFLGNLAFLQSVLVAPFGSNAPLWSLANEFWYYLLFPLGLQVVLGSRSLKARLVAIAAIAAIALLLPATIMAYGLVWLFGVIAFLALDRPTFARTAATWPVGMGAMILLAGTLLASRAQLRIGNDFVIGAAFAAALPWVARAKAPSALYRRAGFILSEMSYTLYLVHFPLMAWIYFTFLAPGQLTFGATSIVALAVILAVTMVYTFAIWWLFERNTDRVRIFIAEATGERWSRATTRRLDQQQ